MEEPKAKTSSGMAIAGLVLGIIAIATSFLPIINNLSFFLALIGGLLSAIALFGAMRGKHTAKGMSIAGVVLAIVSVVIVLATQSAYSAALKAASDELTSGSKPVATTDGGEQAAEPKEEAKEEAPAESPKEEEAPKSDDADYAHMAVGQSVTLANGVTVCFNEVEQGLVNYDDSLITRVNVTYTNGGDKNASFNPFDWKGEDANGAQRSYAFFTDGTNELSSGTLSPGGTATGNIYFEDGTVRVLYYSNMFSSTASIGWDIA